MPSTGKQKKDINYQPVELLNYLNKKGTTSNAPAEEQRIKHSEQGNMKTERKLQFSRNQTQSHGRW